MAKKSSTNEIVNTMPKHYKQIENICFILVHIQCFVACPLYYLCNIVGIRFVQIRLFIAVQQYWEMGCLFYIYFTFGHYFVWRKKVNGSTIDKHKIALKTVSQFVHTCKTHVSNNLCVKPTQQATRIHILPMILLLFLLFSILFGPLNRATAIVYLVNICLSPPL